MLNEPAYYRHGRAEIAGVARRAARPSYVGEAGWKLTCPIDGVVSVYELLHRAGARPVGLLAQTSMRMEKGFLAHGHDLDSDVSPLEAGLESAVRWSKDFVGKKALPSRKERPPRNRIIGIVLEDRDATPTGNEPVYRGGTIVGKTTSAAFGYRVDRPVALAMIEIREPAHVSQQPFEVDIAGTRFPGSMTRGAAFDPEGSLMRLAHSDNGWQGAGARHDRPELGLQNTNT